MGQHHPGARLPGSPQALKGVSFDLSKANVGIAHWRDRTLIGCESLSLNHCDTTPQVLAEFALNVEMLVPGLDWVSVETARPVNMNHAEIHFGMMGTLSILCYRNFVALEPANVKTVKKVLSGSGNATKAEMLAAARARFPDVSIANHDEADAVGVGVWFLENCYVDDTTLGSS